jgi:hypothetical protein
MGAHLQVLGDYFVLAAEGARDLKTVERLLSLSHQSTAGHAYLVWSRKTNGGFLPGTGWA